MKKKIFTLTLSLTLSFFSIVSATVTYPYGINQYGEKNVRFKGNLNASGLGVEQRPSTANRHDLKLHNVNNGVDTPAGAFLETVQYDIQPLPGEPLDKFSKKSGYHVVPLDEELIKDLAQKANGNPDYVWKQINQKAQQAQASSSKFAEPVYVYAVNNVPYINLGSVIYFSGGGDPEMIEAGGDGITSPIFRTTYKTTNRPEIVELKQEGQGIRIKAIGHSVFNTSVNGKIIVNGDETTAKQVFTKSSPVQNYSVIYEGIIPFSQLTGLKQGENKLTLRVGDTFGRTTEDEITVIVGEIQNLKVVDLTVSPNPAEQGGSATATVIVRNEAGTTLTSPVVLKVEGAIIGTQMVTLAPGEEKTLTFSFSVPEKNTVHVQATINPAKNQPEDETTYADNTKDITVRALAKKLEEKESVAPEAFNLSSEVPGGQSDLRRAKKTPVTVVFKSGGFYNEYGEEYEVEANTNITVSYPGYSETFSKKLGMKKSEVPIQIEFPTPDYKAFGTKYKYPIPESGYLDVKIKADINTNDLVVETNTNDNVSEGIVRIYWSKTKIIQDKK